MNSLEEISAFLQAQLARVAAERDRSQANYARLVALVERRGFLVTEEHGLDVRLVDDDLAARRNGLAKLRKERDRLQRELEICQDQSSLAFSGLADAISERDGLLALLVRPFADDKWLAILPYTTPKKSGSVGCTMGPPFSGYVFDSRADAVAAVLSTIQENDRANSRGRTVCDGDGGGGA